MKRILCCVLFALPLAACSQIAFRAVDQARPFSTDPETVAAIEVPEGFRAVRVAEGLTYPSSIDWDAEGRLLVLESHTVPIPLLAPRIVAVEHDGTIAEVPMTGAAAPDGGIADAIVVRDGWIYLSHEQKDGRFAISRVPSRGGEVQAILRDLPARGDHDVNYMVFDAEGALYFGLGSATNSGVVSSQDPVNRKWMEKYPEEHEIPCRDLVLTGATFTDLNALTGEDNDTATTGAFQPYGKSGATRVAGESPCQGSLYRLAPEAAAGREKRAPELLAWGLRNPVALAFDGDGTLLIGMHGADVRGTRPVLDDPDAIYRLRKGAWYGWPEYSAELVPFTDPRYLPPVEFLAAGHSSVAPLIDVAASGLTAPDRSLLVAVTKPHAALGGMTVVPRHGPFARWAGKLLISEMGDFKPTTDAVKPKERAGFQVEMVDLKTGQRSVFARNRGKGDAKPASMLDQTEGFERPVDAKFGPDGLLYVADFGVFNPTETAAKVLPKTGKIFRIEPLAGTAKP